MPFDRQLLSRPLRPVDHQPLRILEEHARAVLAEPPVPEDDVIGRLERFVIGALPSEDPEPGAAPRARHEHAHHAASPAERARSPDRGWRSSGGSPRAHCHPAPGQHDLPDDSWPEPGAREHDASLQPQNLVDQLRIHICRQESSVTLRLRPSAAEARASGRRYARIVASCSPTHTTEHETPEYLPGIAEGRWRWSCLTF